MSKREKSSKNSKDIWALALHGGAGFGSSKKDKLKEEFLADLLKQGGKMLADGASSVETVQAMVRELEASGLFLAGKGSSPNQDGVFELDAAIMDGETRHAGAVAGLSGFKYPINVAERVMKNTPYVMLVGDGAAKFADEQGCKKVKNPKDYYTPVKYESFDLEKGKDSGTVGAVALDIEGGLAAATSTGGAPNKQTGRVGDSPIIGAGTWADERVAVSCTGAGEDFIRANAATDVSARINYKRKSVDEAAREVLENVVFLGGRGGMICIDKLGRITMPFVTESMARGSIHSNGKVFVGTI